jgi:hypothetical protein
LSSSPRIACRCMPHQMLAPRCATRPASTSLPSRHPSRVEPSTTQLAATNVGSLRQRTWTRVATCCTLRVQLVATDVDWSCSAASDSFKTDTEISRPAGAAVTHCGQ